MIKITAVSGDMAVKLGLGVLLLGGLAMLIYTAKSKASAAAGAIANVAATSLNPNSDQNVVYLGVNTATGGNNSTDSIGTRIYEFFHPSEATTLPGSTPASDMTTAQFPN